jgi:hypothetical protein
MRGEVTRTKVDPYRPERLRVRLERVVARKKSVANLLAALCKQEASIKERIAKECENEPNSKDAAGTAEDR